jgi:hypothetical protein
MKKSCKFGHPYSGDNLALTKDGHRECRECRRVSHRNQRAKARNPLNNLVFWEVRHRGLHKINSGHTL